MPVLLPMDATAELPETQVPPVVAEARVEVVPTGKVNVPVIADGDGFNVTVTVWVADPDPLFTVIVNASVPE